MTTFTDVFERKEVKYCLNERQYRAMLSALDGLMEPDVFGRTRIISRYLDTPERALIERSMDKPLYKEKLRLRGYGSPRADDRVFVEIKKKYQGIVYKRRIGCSLAAACAYLDGMPYERACLRYPLPDPVMAAESLAPRSVQIAREIDSFVDRYRPLLPSMQIVCERTAYAKLLDGSAVPIASDTPDDLRITFDERISYQDLFATQDTAGRALLPAGDVVMEIKAAGPFPLWLVHALDACEARPSSFSKYGAAYRACSLRCAEVPAPAFSSAPESAPAHVLSNARAHAPALVPAVLCQPSARAMQAHAEEKAERLAAALRDSRPRHVRVPAKRRSALEKSRHAATRG